MKKILLILSVVVLLSGCDLINEITDSVYEERYSGQKLYDPHLEDEDFETVADIVDWISGNITYQDDYGKDSGQAPEETLRLGTGDCEDFAILLMNIAFFELMIKMELIIVDNDNMTIQRTVENGGLDNGHIMNRYNGIIYEPQNGYIYSGVVNYSLSFNKIFNG